MITLDVILNEVKNLSRSKRAGRSKPACWVIAPQSSLANASTVQGVALAPNEDVQWSWTHAVNGYSIVWSLPKKRQSPFASLRVTTQRNGDSK